MHASTTLNGRRAPYTLLVLAVTAFLITLLGLGASAPARADGPGEGTPWVVTLGDSYISG